MRVNRKYLVAVVLLAVLAAVFGLAGTVAPAPEVGSPQRSLSSSDSVAHFQNPPTFDSDWVDITDKGGQAFNITHDLNSMNITVDITGKTTLDGGVHQRNLGLTGYGPEWYYTPGWCRIYGGADEEFAECVVETIFLGGRYYTIAGCTHSYGAGGDDFWLITVNAGGNVVFNNTYGGSGSDRAYSVVRTSDGGYALVGETYSYGAGSGDFWLVKTYLDGSIQWNQTYGGTGYEVAESLVHTNDGGYALVGFKYGSGIWLVKTNEVGDMQWSKTYGGTPTSLVQTSDGGYAIAGSYASDFYLVKTDEVGDMQWNRTYGGAYEDCAHSLVQTSDGGYALAGVTESPGPLFENLDFWLVKTDEVGDMQWSKTYGDLLTWDTAQSVVQTSDGGYAIAGRMSVYGRSYMDFGLVKTDSAGNMQWCRTYGGASQDEACSVVQTGDGGYAIAGSTASFGAGGSDFLLVKTDCMGNILESGLAWTDSTNNTITLYRGATDPYWNYVRVRIWVIEEPTWMFGDINQDGVVDINDLAILSKNYGKTFSLLSLTGIIATAGIHTYKKRKHPK